jgi:integrase
MYLALRREELVNLRWSDFDDNLEWVQVTGKGRRTRYIPVAPRLRTALKPHQARVGWVFPGRITSHIHPGTFYRWLAELAERSGISHVHPHALRHTCLATMNDETGDLRTTQAFAGHARIESTVGYTRATETKLRAAVATLDYSAPDRGAGGGPPLG